MSLTRFLFLLRSASILEPVSKDVLRQHDAHRLQAA